MYIYIYVYYIYVYYIYINLLIYKYPIYISLFIYVYLSSCETNPLHPNHLYHYLLQTHRTLDNATYKL